MRHPRHDELPAGRTERPAARAQNVCTQDTAIPPSSAPARLAVGFGPKEEKPYASQVAGDSPLGSARSRVGPPPPGATRGLGASWLCCLHPEIYSRRTRLSTVE